MAHMLMAVAALIVLAGSPAAAQSTPAGKWLAEDIDGGVVNGPQTTLDVAEDGTVSGTGGCNGYRGTAEFSVTAINFGPLAATKKACEPAVMAQETKFHKALEEAKGWQIDAATRKLTLLDAKGKELVRFAPLE